MSDRDQTDADAAEPLNAADSGDLSAEQLEQLEPPTDDAPDVQPGSSDDDSPDALGDPDDGLKPRERRRTRLEAAQRRKRERMLWFGMVAAGLLVLGVFFYFFWPVMAGRLDAVKQVDQAQALLERAKPTVASIDKLVTTQLSASATPGVPDTAPQILVARRDLKQALALVDSAMPHLTEDEQTHANSVRAAAQARLDMLDHAPAILVASVKAVKAKAFVDQASEEASSATVAETVARNNYQKATASSVESASVSLQRIKGQLGDVRQLYTQAAAAFPGMGIERFGTYIDMRLQAVKLFSAATTAWLGGDKVGAATQFAAYGRQLAKATASIASPPTAGAAPGQAFRKVAGSSTDAYNKAKKQAVEADKALSDQ